MRFWFLVLTIFSQEAFLLSKSNVHKAFNSFQFDCESILESAPGYYAIATTII